MMSGPYPFSRDTALLFSFITFFLRFHRFPYNTAVPLSVQTAAVIINLQREKDDHYEEKAGLTLILTILCFLMSAFPAMAGEWHKTAEDQYQYIKDDGTKATGLLELKDGTYYLDDKGNRKTSYWLRYKGDWYFFGEDGQMATDTWVDNYHVGEDGQMDKMR